MLSKYGIFRNPIEDYFVDNAGIILKPRTQQQPWDSYWLQQNIKIKRVSEVIVCDEDERKIVAHKFQLNPSISVKKAIVYLPGNCVFISDSLPNMAVLLEKMSDGEQIACYCQHYRGRGSNQHQDNFSDYTTLQDAKDQAALIKKLVQEEGFKPEDILVVGYSYGSTVGLWALYYLITQYGPSYSNIKFYGDRGIGNLFNFRYLKPFIWDQAKAHEKLHQKGFMPDISLHKILTEFLPDSFVFQIEKDESIWEDYSLLGALAPNELSGRTFLGKSENSTFSHLAPRDQIGLTKFKNIHPHHFMIAIITETPIYIKFCDKFISDISVRGYALTDGAKLGDNAFIELPPLNVVSNSTAGQVNSITSDMLNILLPKLHKYCLVRADRATKSTLGVAYKKGTLGWLAKDQIIMAIQLMSFLCHAHGPDVGKILSLQHQSGPHHSGELKEIYFDIISFITEYKKLLEFNAWVTSMNSRRQERMNKYVNQEELINEWVDIEKQSLDNHQQSLDNASTANDLTRSTFK